MKIFPVLFLSALATPSLAQSTPNAPTSAASACGSADVNFEVKADKHRHPLGQPTADKALVYFIEDDSLFASIFKPITRVGLDGSWTGATHGESYFYFLVGPGEHHVCASTQSEANWDPHRKTAAAHFTAHAGDVFYFRVRNIWSKEWLASIDLEPVDSDEALLLMSTFSFSTSRARE